MTEVQEKALKVLGEEDIQEGSPEATARDILMGCAEYSEELAEKIANQQTPAKNAMTFMRNEARKIQKNSSACIGDDNAVAIILESLGIEKGKAQGIVEGGLMYALIRGKVEKWMPYGEKAEPVPEKREPVPEKPEQETAPAEQPEKKAAVDFSLEDLGL